MQKQMLASTSITRRDRFIHAALLLLVVLAGVDLMVRGPLGITNADDLASPYVSARRFLAQRDPYPAKNFVAEWHAAGAPAAAQVFEPGQHSVYPPVTLAAFAPFAILPWLVSLYTFVALSILLYLCLIYYLAMEVGESWGSWLRLGFVASCLALSPFHGGIRHANLSVLAFVLCGLGLVFARRSQASLAGLLLAIGFCLKPTTGFTIVLLMLCFGWRRAFAVCAAAATTVTVAALAWMEPIGPAWRASYAENLTYAFSPMGALSFTVKGLSRFDDLNLQVPLYSILRSAHSANLLSYGVGLALFALWIVIFYRKRSLLQPVPFNWAATASLLLIALLPIYQRNYNAVVIVFALVWAFQHAGRRTAQAVYGLSVLLILPGEAMLRRSGAAEHFSDSTLWNVVVMSQATWAVLGVVLILLYVQLKERTKEPVREA